MSQRFDRARKSGDPEIRFQSPFQSGWLVRAHLRQIRTAQATVAHLCTLRFSRREKECSERVPSKNAKVDREHRDSPEHSSSQPRPCKYRRTCDFCVSRFSHDFREHIPFSGTRLRPLRTLSTLRSGQIPVFLHAASNVADCLEHFQNRIRRVGRCAHSESSPDFPQTTSAPADR